MRKIETCKKVIKGQNDDVSYRNNEKLEIQPIILLP